MNQVIFNKSNHSIEHKNKKKPIYCGAAFPGGRVYSCLALHSCPSLHMQFQLPFKGIY